MHQLTARNRRTTVFEIASQCMVIPYMQEATRINYDYSLNVKLLAQNHYDLDYDIIIIEIIMVLS